MADDLCRVQMTISGKVQGVFYRASTLETAQKEGLSGWVKNMDDGSVIAEFQGDEGQIARIIEWCWQGPPMAQVDMVSVAHKKPQTDQQGFHVRY